MNQKKQLSILEFSRLTGIKRENLRFYDRIGLLSPETRGENNYRYYSRHQLNTAYLISGLRGLGVGIEDIKRYAAERTPQKTLELFARQEERIQEEIRRLRETSSILQIHSGMVREALLHNENALLLQEKQRESVFLCPPAPMGMDGDEGWVFAYDYAEAHGVNLGFPQGALIARECLVSAEADVSERCYFKVGDAGNGGNAEKPAGLYAVIYGRCDPWKTEPLYRRLLEYIWEQGLRVCGDAYEEYPLGELAVPEIDQSCVRVEIPVDKTGE